jgi:hypothetical protein
VTETAPVSNPSIYSVYEGKFNPNIIRFLVYGESGAGKTVFASTWPSPVFLDIDKGMSSITKPVYRMDINSWQDLQDAAIFLQNEQHPFKTVIIDSANEIQYLAMQNVLKTYTSVRRSYDSLPAVSDYGKSLSDFDSLTRYFRALPLNVVFIAQVAPREAEGDVVFPQLVGKNTANNLSRMMDCIGYLYKVEGSAQEAKTRVMVFDAVNYVTKDRSGRLPQTLSNPTYDRLLQYWTAEAKPNQTQEKENENA